MLCRAANETRAHSAQVLRQTTMKNHEPAPAARVCASSISQRGALKMLSARQTAAVAKMLIYNAKTRRFKQTMARVNAAEPIWQRSQPQPALRNYAMMLSTSNRIRVS